MAAATRRLGTLALVGTMTAPDYESYHRWAELDAAWAREIVKRREAAEVTP